MMRTTLLIALSFCVPSTVWAQGVYFLKGQKIKWVDAEGGGVRIVSENTVQGGASLAIDHASGRLYRSNPYSYSNLDGTGFESIDLGIYPNVMTFDFDAGKAYFSDSSANNPSGMIYQSNLDGSDLGVLFSTVPDTEIILSLAVDAGAGRMYWAGRNYSGPNFSVYRANLDGTDIQLLRMISPSILSSVAIDPVGQRVYWGDNGALGYGDFNGNFPLYFRSAANHYMGPIHLQRATGKVYWAEGYDAQSHREDLYRSNLDGSNVELLMSYPQGVLGQVDGLAVDSIGRLYVAGSDITTYTSPHSVIERMNPNGTARVVIAEEYFGGGGILAARFDLGFVFVASGSYISGRIAKTNLSGSQTETFSKTDQFYTSLQIDPISERVFWSLANDYDNDGFCVGTLLQQPLEGPPEYGIGFVSGCGVQVLAVDGATEQVYFSDGSNVLVSEFNTCCNGTVVNPVPGPLGARITVDLSLETIFWGTLVGGSSELRSTPFGGSDVTLLAGLTAVPEHIQVDATGGKLYWVENTSIRRANMDGSLLETIVSGLPYKPAQFSFDKESQRIFWLLRPGDETPSLIQRANLDGSDVNLVVSDLYIAGFAVDPRPTVCTPTSRFADITGLPDNVEFQDIAAVVDAFRGQPDISPALSDLYPCDAMGQRCLGDGIIDFRDVSQAVNAFRGFGCQ